MLLRRLAASTPSGAAGSVTQSSAPSGSSADSQSSAEGPPSSFPSVMHGFLIPVLLFI
jgi:hypothetical protein